MTPPNIGTYWGNSFWNQQAQVPATSVGAYSNGLGLLPLTDVSSSSNIYSTGACQNGPLFPGGASLSAGNTQEQVDTSSLLRTWMFIQQMNKKQDTSTGTTCSDGDYNAEAGKKLAKCADSVVKQRGSTTGECAKGVRLSLEKALGESFEGSDAYKWANKLKQRSDFKELDVSSKELKDLPSGAIVVWGKTDDSPHGHISIADGKGNEISDHKTKQLTSLRSHKNFRVFIPVENT